MIKLDFWCHHSICYCGFTTAKCFVTAHYTMEKKFFWTWLLKIICVYNLTAARFTDKILWTQRSGLAHNWWMIHPEPRKPELLCANTVRSAALGILFRKRHRIRTLASTTSRYCSWKRGVNVNRRLVIPVTPEGSTHRPITREPLEPSLP